MNSRSLLGVSVVANIVLLGALIYSFNDRSGQPSEKPATQSAITNTTSIARPSVRTITVTNQLERNFDWRAVESENYKEYIANLRSIGCPEETIRDIIIADVNKLFESRRKELASGKRFEFWRTEDPFARVMDEEAIQKRAELAKEKKALIKELLGIEVDDPSALAAVANPLSMMLDFLSEEKQAKVGELMQQFQAKIARSYSGGSIDVDEMKAIMKMQKEFEADLAGILTPEEFENFQLSLSHTAMSMRMEMRTFNPTEQEFRDIFAIRKAFDDEYGYLGLPDAKEERQRRITAEQDMKKQIKSMLGEERYKEYERAQDWKFQNIAKFAERNGLQQEAAIQVYEMDRIAREEIDRLRMDGNLDHQKQLEVIRELEAETDNNIRNLLGEKAFEAYKNGPGRVR